MNRARSLTCSFADDSEAPTTSLEVQNFIRNCCDISRAYAHVCICTTVIFPNRLSGRECYGGERAWQLTREMEPNDRHKEQKTMSGERKAKRNMDENGESGMHSS